MVASANDCGGVTLKYPKAGPSMQHQTDLILLDRSYYDRVLQKPIPDTNGLSSKLL
jgi:hypothetical protein